MAEYLERNQVPLDKQGKPIQTLNLSESNYTDGDMEGLSASLRKNTCFTGGIDLSNNRITDLGVLELTESLSSSLTPITALDLSGNNLKERSGIYLGNYLGIQNNPLQELSIDRCNVSSIGLQRILENLPENKKLRTLRLGEVSAQGVSIIASYLPSAQKLINITLSQEGEWDEETRNTLIGAFEANKSVRHAEIGSENWELKEEIESLIHRNKHAYHEKLKKKDAAKSVDPKHYAEKIQYYIENSVQNLPVRIFLQNSLGTILNLSLIHI